MPPNATSTFKPAPWRARLWLRAKQQYGNSLHEFVRKTLPFFERMGLHLTLNHYYEPVPDTRKLRDALWSRRSELVGVNLNESAQLALLAGLAACFKAEYDSLPLEAPPQPGRFYLNNPAFPSVDAEIFYSMIRRFKPKRIIEIGSGQSTLLAAETILKNREEDPAYRCELVAVEPYPSGFLKAGVPGLSRLIQQPAQEVPLEEFDALGQDDILFIDSSHVLKIGSDVQYEYLEILPRLRPGVLVHIHDIHFPSDYPKDLVLESRRFWTEQYLLQAFLTFNDSFEVLWAGTYMHFTHPDALAAAFKSYDRNGRWPGSFWMRRIR